MIGRVTRYEPPRVLAYTWDEESGKNWGEVTFELTPRGNDVLLVIRHARLPDRGGLVGVAGGWHAHADILSDRLNGREPRGFWSHHAKVAAEYERRIPPG